MDKCKMDYFVSYNLSCHVSSAILIITTRTDECFFAFLFVYFLLW